MTTNNDITTVDAVKTIHELMIACTPDSKYYRVGQMAIQALEQNESAEEWYKLFVKKLDEQEPCDDDYQTDMDEAWKQAKRDCPNCIWHDTSCTKFYCQQIARRQIMIILSLLEICEGVQADDKAGFMEKETAKVVAYEHIAEILKGVQNDTKGS